MRYRIVYEEILDLARATTRNGAPATKDPVIRQRLAQFYVELEMMRFTSYRAFSQILKGGNPGPRDRFPSSRGRSSTNGCRNL